MNIEVGKVFYFGYRKTPNTVARVYLKGPRGGEFVAHVRPDGSCRKM